MTSVVERVPLVEMRDINVAFGGVHAVRSVSIDLFSGEVIGLVGGNGAGKSTLMRVLSGAHPADSGEILVDGQVRAIHNTRDAKNLQIETIYQTLALADNIARAGQCLPRARGEDALREPGRRGHGERDPRGHGSPQPQLHELHPAGRIAFRRPASGRGHRPGGPFQRAHPHHGRAHRGPRAG